LGFGFIFPRRGLDRLSGLDRLLGRRLELLLGRRLELLLGRRPLDRLLLDWALAADDIEPQFRYADTPYHDFSRITLGNDAILRHIKEYRGVDARLEFEDNGTKNAYRLTQRIQGDNVAIGVDSGPRCRDSHSKVACLPS